MAAAASTDDELTRARDLGIDTCGRIAEFWGFTRTMGRAFGLLYLSAEPLPQTEIQRRLGISAGSASMTLAALGRWGVVHRIWVRGERREHYEAETDFWKMIAGVLNERERREITAAIDTVERAEAGARAVEASTKGKAKAEAEFVSARLARLHDICRLGQTMLDMLLGQLKLDVGRFRDVLRVSSSLGALEGSPSPPAMDSAQPNRAPSPRSSSLGTLEGSPSPPAKDSARQSRAASTRSAGNEKRREPRPARRTRGSG